MKFIELFAGIGGFRLGLEKAGHECVWANEFMPKARSIYEHNFGHSPDGRDIRTVQPDEIPSADLLVGGFPCATFSVAGRRTGFSTEDTRGTLFFEICRIISSKRIPYIFLENVKGLLNHDGGRTFGVILASLDELGYDVQWECVNSKNFGVPQNRERVFIVGHLRGFPRPKVFPLGRCFAEDVEQSAEAQGQGERVQGACLPTLDAHYYKGGGTRAVIAEAGDGDTSDESVRATHWRRNHFRDIKGNHTPTLTANMGTGGNNVPYVTGVEVRPVLTPDREEKRQNGRRIKEHNEPAFTLTAQDRHGLMVGTSLRKLTPLECERLQALPEYENNIKIAIWNYLDLQNIYADADSQCLKSQKHAGNAEKTKSQKIAKSAEQNLNPKFQKIKKLVALDVHIDLGQKRILFRNLKALKECANIAVNDSMCLHQELPEDFAQLLVHTLIWLAKNQQIGKEELLPNMISFTPPRSGEAYVSVFGQEIEELVNDAEKFINIKKECLKFITSEHGKSFQNSDLNLQTLLSYVGSAIVLFIQDKIKIKNSFCLNMTVSHGHTQYYADGSLVPDSQRYERCGRAVTVNVIEQIARRLPL